MLLMQVSGIKALALTLHEGLMQMVMQMPRLPQRCVVNKLNLIKHLLQHSATFGNKLILPTTNSQVHILYIYICSIWTWIYISPNVLARKK